MTGKEQIPQTCAWWSKGKENAIGYCGCSFPGWIQIYGDLERHIPENDPEECCSRCFCFQAREDSDGK